MTKQLEQLLWILNLHKCNKKLRKNRNGIQKQIEQKKLEKLNEFVFNSTRQHKAE